MGEEEKRACSPVLQMPVNAYKCVYAYIFPFSFHCYLALEEKTALPHKQWMSRSRMERNKGPYPPILSRGKRGRKKRQVCYPAVDTDSGGGGKRDPFCSAFVRFRSGNGRTEKERQPPLTLPPPPFSPLFSFVSFLCFVFSWYRLSLSVRGRSCPSSSSSSSR